MTHQALRPSSALCARFMAFVLGSLLSLQPVLAAKAAFDIPAQPAPTALKLFMKQSGAQVLFSNDKLQDVAANAVKGEMEESEALAALFAGTGYAATQSSA